MSLFDEMNFLPPMDIEDEMIPLFPMDNEDDNIYNDSIDGLPILPLRNTVFFPGVVMPITVGRQRSIEAITKAYKSNKIIGVLTQKETDVEEPTANDLYKVGTIARIIKLIRVPDGTTTAILKGTQRFVLEDMLTETPFMQGKVLPMQEHVPNKTKEFEAYINSIKDLAQRIVKLSPNIPPEAGVMLRNIEQNSFLLNFISSNLSINNQDKQSILEKNDFAELWVIDSGTGISEAIQDKIFSPFFTTKKAGEGTGLGLSIISSILEDHSAYIKYVESENTSFVITFPIVKRSNHDL